MFKCIAVLFVVASVAWAAPTEERTCNGGKKEGETVEVGRYWYECKAGDLVQKGCLSEDKKRLNAHDSYKSRGYVIECVESQGSFGFAYKACVAEDGTEHPPQDTWQDVNYWYTCIAQSNSIRGEVTGCVDDGKRFTVGDSVEKGDLLYTCSHTGENIGWNIYPNRNAKTEDPKPADHVHTKQKVPTN